MKNARTDTNSKTYASIKERLDNQENSLNNNINDKLSQISAVPETFVNLAALKSKYPTGKAGIFVTADNGHKYIWVNGSWTDSGVYQSVGVADKSIDPIKLKTTSVVNNKSGKTYNVLSGNKDLYILNEPISEAGIVNVTGKFSSGTVYLYLLKKHSDKFIVIEKSVITVTEGWQSIFTNFYAEGVEMSILVYLVQFTTLMKGELDFIIILPQIIQVQNLSQISSLQTAISHYLQLSKTANLLM